MRAVIAPAGSKSITGQTESKIETNLFNIKATTYNTLNEYGLAGKGGALASVGDEVIGVDQDGLFYVYQQGGTIEKLNIGLAMNRAEFVAHVEANVTHPLVLKKAKNFFRVLDLEALQAGDSVHLIVSHS